jgi:hypothetical protein
LIVLFEPWNLGDAIIAASVARLAPDRFILACNSRWHEVLRLASGDSLNLLPLNLPYVWRTNKNFFSLGDASTLRSKFNNTQLSAIEVISIRGDLRDWIAAHRIFRGAAFSFSGWRQFMARKLDFCDRPFVAGVLPIRNRYRAWAEAVGVQYSAVEHLFASPICKDNAAPIVIHVGAQWRSKQYPHVSQLAGLLRQAGWRVEILAGPEDPLPPEISVNAVLRPRWPKLVEVLRNAAYVICNDSGPMHLAAYLGCRTLTLSRCSNVLEWLPPGVTALSSPSAPRGYRPIPDYWSDKILRDWVLPAEVMENMHL